MKTITINLHKNIIHSFIDNATYKRMDASMESLGERSQSAAASDAENENDGYLITEFCDRRDAILRSRLEFCLDGGSDGTVSFDNSITAEGDYVYTMNVDNTVTETKLRSVAKMMDEYIKRGAILSWYLNAGIEANDTEAGLEILLSEIVSILRGQPWGHRPMQPFGPAMFNYKKGNLR